QALLDDYAAQFAERDAKRSRKGKNVAGDSGEERMANSEQRALSAVERLTERKRFPVLGAFDLCLKCSHLFNILDARGAISVTERVGVIARVRALAVGIARAWVDQQKSQSASAEKSDEPAPVGKKETKTKKP